MKKGKKWDEALEMGIDVLDNQHKIILDLIGDLENAVTASADKRIALTLLDIIENHIFTHFSDEEALLQQHKNRDQHTLAHYALIKELHAYKLEFRNRMKPEKSAAFLEQWFVAHIKESDQPLFADLQRENKLAALLKPVDIYAPTAQERRKHKRIPTKKITDAEIAVECYNTTMMKNCRAEILDLSLGGVRIRSRERHQLGDILVITCQIGRSYRMKEKIKINNNADDTYGAEFISLSQQSERFLGELYGAVNIRNF